MKRLVVVLISIILMSLCLACSSNDMGENESNSFSSKSTLSFADLLYTSDYVFTCYKPDGYEVIEKGNGIIEINGETFDDRVYFKRYTFDIIDIVKSPESVGEIKVDEFYKDAYYEQASLVENLKENVLYLAFAYSTNTGYTMYFQEALVELDADGVFAVSDVSNPWESVDDVKYTYEKELKGIENMTVETWREIKRGILEYYSDNGKIFNEKNNYKIFSSTYLNDQTDTVVLNEHDRNNSDNNFEVVVYEQNAKNGKVTIVELPITFSAVNTQPNDWRE